MVLCWQTQAPEHWIFNILIFLNEAKTGHTPLFAFIHLTSKSLALLH